MDKEELDQQAKESIQENQELLKELTGEGE
jgi:hypothetical protein